MKDSESTSSGNSSDVPSPFGNPWFYSTLVCLGLLFFIGGVVVQGYLNLIPPQFLPSTNQTTAQASNNTRNAESSLKPANTEWIKKIPANSRKKSLGDTNAPVSIVEFTDFKCPYCRRFVTTVFPKILENYVATGKVHYKIRHFPLTQLHPQAPLLANASECAAEQNRFWHFRRYAIRNIDRFGKVKNIFGKIGKKIGISDMNRYRKCVQNQEKMSIVEREWNKARELGIKATPTFLINGEKIEGGRSYNKMKTLIENKLTG